MGSLVLGSREPDATGEDRGSGEDRRAEDDEPVIRIQPGDRGRDVHDEHRDEQAQDREGEHDEPGEQRTGQ